MLLRAIQRSLLQPKVIDPSSFLKATCTTPSSHVLPILSRTIATTPHFRVPSTTAETSPPPAPPSLGVLAAAKTDTPPTPHESLALLKALKAQASHYITIKIQGFSFLVTPGDLVVLPFLLKGARVGDTLRITHATVLGSRNYTMKGNPYIDERLFECRATVVEETAEPMRIKEKKKRRTRRTKTVKSKHKYSVLRIKELIINDVPAAETATAGGSLSSTA